MAGDLLHRRTVMNRSHEWLTIKTAHLLARSSLLPLMLGANSLVMQAQVTITPAPTNTPSATDLFDVSRGTVVLAASPQNPGSDPRSALGYSNDTSIEPLITYFQDGAPPGTVDFIVFRTPAAVTISGFNLFTYDDSYPSGGGGRGMSHLALLSSLDGNNYSPLASATLTNSSYLVGFGSWSILVSVAFPPATAQFFRLEVTRSGSTGPRIVELDAVQAPAPPVAALEIRLSQVELCWATATNTWYQLQYSTALSPELLT